MDGGSQFRGPCLVAFACALVAQALAGAAASPTPRVRTCFGAPVTVLGTRGPDRIAGTDGPDVILGRGGDDVIVGHDGRDRICGGSGADRLDGRYGSDLIDAGEGHDPVVRGGPGSDLLLGGRGRDVLEEAAGMGTLVGGPGGDRLLGGAGDSDSDHLFGGPANDHLNGGLGGSDVLFGGMGNDSLIGGVVSYEFAAAALTAATAPSNAIDARGEGNDYFTDVEGLVGSPHGDVLTGSPGPDVLRGGRGDDTIDAAAGDDVVDGGPGSDDLDGGGGVDRLTFADSPVGVRVSLRDGTAQDAGTKTLAGFETLEGSFFDDELTGTEGPDWISGSYGRNGVFGLGGNDEIWFASHGDAGDGQDSCGEAFDVESCEIEITPEPIPLPFLTAPTHLEDLDRLGVVRGGTPEGRGSTIGRVVVGVRRMTSGGCWWWKDGRFTRGTCGVVHGNRVRIRNDRWSLTVNAPLKSGSYRVSVHWPKRLGYFVECGGFYAPTCVSLHVP
ncbi:MAG TPA: calcium-binding protein [Actinomycetota bacterium]|nr:calcium-binding protein [Actinomycetota bacterium]